MAGFDHVLIGRGFHDTQQRCVAPVARAHRTDFVFREPIAQAAVAHAFNGATQCLAQASSTLRIVLQEVISHASRRTLAHPWQAAQRLDQRAQRFGLGNTLVHQNGNFMPGGRGRPAVTEDIFSWLVASALRRASLKAAATRSSSMSLSSSSSEGSMVTRRTSCRQLIETLTRPPPDSPSTTISASASWAFFMFSCICCACFI